MVALTQRKPLLSILRDFVWHFPYYLAGGVLVSLFHAIAYAFAWQTALFSLTVVYLVCRSYQIYLDSLEAQRIHVEQLSALHFRAIEAKDETTHEHLGRVQIYALEVGKVLGLDQLQTQALRAASLLHEIGKLAVPGFIINKPDELAPRRSPCLWKMAAVLRDGARCVWAAAGRHSGKHLHESFKCPDKACQPNDCRRLARLAQILPVCVRRCNGARVQDCPCPS